MVHDFSLELMHRDYALAFRQPNLAQDIIFSQFSSYLWTVLCVFCVLLVAIMNGLIVLNQQKKGQSRFWTIDSIEWIFCKASFNIRT